jgi:hypothetical protein
MPFGIRQIRYLPTFGRLRVNIIFGIIIIILIYIFALNGRYKPIEGATYGIYIDSWTGKVHSSLIEFEKQNR